MTADRSAASLPPRRRCLLAGPIWAAGLLAGPWLGLAARAQDIDLPPHAPVPSHPPASAPAPVPKPERAGPDGLTASELAEALQQLQAAVLGGQPRVVAALVAFPLQVNSGRRRGSERVTAAGFPAAYARIFTPEVVSALLAQSADSLFRSARGAMIGRGELWLAGVCQPPEPQRCHRHAVRLVAVNVPAPATERAFQVQAPASAPL